MASPFSPSGMGAALSALETRSSCYERHVSALNVDYERKGRAEANTYRLRASGSVDNGIFLVDSIVGDVPFSLSRHACGFGTSKLNDLDSKLME